jgi:uncharacterized membrane protein YgdD (TMEM256/DUF423 family)
MIVELSDTVRIWAHRIHPGVVRLVFALAFLGLVRSLYSRAWPVIAIEIVVGLLAFSFRLYQIKVTGSRAWKPATQPRDPLLGTDDPWSDD